MLKKLRIKININVMEGVNGWLGLFYALLFGVKKKSWVWGGILW
jgi:hypothetical protein